MKRIVLLLCTAVLLLSCCSCDNSVYPAASPDGVGNIGLPPEEVTKVITVVVVGIGPEKDFVWMQPSTGLASDAEKTFLVKMDGGYFRSGTIWLNTGQWHISGASDYIVGQYGRLCYYSNKKAQLDDGTEYFIAEYFNTELDDSLELTGGELWTWTDKGTLSSDSYNGLVVAGDLFATVELATEEEQAEKEPLYRAWNELWKGVAVTGGETAEETAGAWGEAFAAAQVGMPEENIYAPEEFRILESSVEEVSGDGNRLVYSFSLAARHSEGLPRLWICGGGRLGTDEWDGWVLNRRWVTLERGEDGVWQAVEFAPYRLHL